MSSRRSTWRQIARAFRSAPTGVISAVMIAIIIVLMIVGPSVFGAGATEVNLAYASQGPSAQHLLGTDALGHDILDRTLAATRLSIILTFAAVAISAVVGCVIGAMIASAGPKVRRAGATVIDSTMSFGGLLLAIFIVAIVGVGARGAVIGVGLAFAPAFARFTYSLVASVNARDYVVAARLSGLSRTRVLAKHVLPNIADSLAIGTFTSLAETLIAVAALSFLGLGVQSPQYEWGSMLTTGVQAFYVTPWAALAPAIMIAFSGAAFGLFGDAIARAVNPLLWEQRPRLAARRLRRGGRSEQIRSPVGTGVDT